MIDQTSLYLGAKAHRELFDDFRQRFLLVSVREISTPPQARITRDEATQSIIDQMRCENASKLAEPHVRMVWDLFLESVDTYIQGISKL